MKLHKNASLTPKQRQQIKDLYGSGNYTQTELSEQFRVTRKTIFKWIHRPTIEDSKNVAQRATSLTSEFVSAVKAYR